MKWQCNTRNCSFLPQLYKKIKAIHLDNHLSLGHILADAPWNIDMHHTTHARETFGDMPTTICRQELGFCCCWADEQVTAARRCLFLISSEIGQINRWQIKWLTVFSKIQNHQMKQDVSKATIFNSKARIFLYSPVLSLVCAVGRCPTVVNLAVVERSHDTIWPVLLAALFELLRGGSSGGLLPQPTPTTH